MRGAASVGWRRLAGRRGVGRLAVQEQRGRANMGGLAAFVGPSSGGWRSVNARRALILRDKSQADMTDNGNSEKNRKCERMLGRYG